MSKEPVELLVTIIRETPDAILVNDGTVDAWIPKSQLLEEPEEQDGGMVEITIPGWLAEDKELI